MAASGRPWRNGECNQQARVDAERRAHEFDERDEFPEIAVPVIVEHPPGRASALVGGCFVRAQRGVEDRDAGEDEALG